MPTRKPSNKTAKVDNNNLVLKKLRRLNFIAAAFHTLQGVLVLVLSDPTKGLQPVTTNYLARDDVASEAAGSPVLTTASSHLFDLNLAYLVATFFFISAVAHLLVAMWLRKRYEGDLKQGINRIRWIEYAFSASIMMLGIALLTGIFDIASLLMIFALTALMSILGLAMETRNQKAKQVDWSNYSIGVIAGIVPWLVLVIYVWGAVVYGSGVPGFIYWIYASLFVLFSCFAINMYLQYKRIGRWSAYLFGEKVYIVLSFLAKTALAWQVFAGTLRS